MSPLRVFFNYVSKLVIEGGKTDKGTFVNFFFFSFLGIDAAYLLDHEVMLMTTIQPVP